MRQKQEEEKKICGFGLLRKRQWEFILKNLEERTKLNVVSVEIKKQLKRYHVAGRLPI